MVRITLFALLVLLTTAAESYAAVDPAAAKSGRDFLESCHGFISFRPDPTGTLQHRCAEIVGSAVEYEQALKHACIPSRETIRKVMQTVVEYLDMHPEMLDRDMTVLTSTALKAKFPCSKGI